MSDRPNLVKTPSSLPSFSPLEGSRNFETWSDQTNDWFLLAGLQKILEGTWTAPSPGTDITKGAGKKAYLEWERANEISVAALRSTLTTGPRAQVIKLKSAYETWLKLRLNYKPKGSETIGRIRQEIYSSNRATCASMQEYADRLKKLADEALQIDPLCAISDFWLVQYFIQGLSTGYDTFLTSFEQVHNLVGDSTATPPIPAVTFDLITRKAVEHDMRYQFNQGASELSGQSLGVAGVAIDHHQVICGNCQKPGHLTDKCYRGVNAHNAPSVIRKRKQAKRDEESRKKPS
jgi:hypothetical protein